MAEQLLQGSLEDNCLTLLAWHDVHAPTIALRVDVELWSTRAYQKIADLSVDHLARFGSPPKAHLRDLLEADLRRGDEGRFLEQILRAMEELAGTIQPDYVLSQLDRFIKIQQLTKVAETMADSLHAGDLEAAEEALGSTALTRKVDYPRAWLSDEEGWLSFLDQDEDNQFSSGIGVLDDRGVTPRRGGAFLIIGPTGMGKSWWLDEIGKANVVLAHKNVLHVTLEQDIEEVKLRYTMSFLSMTESEVPQVRVPVYDRDSLGRFTTLDFSNITPDSVAGVRRSELQDRLKKFRRRGRLCIQWFPTGMLTVAQLSSFLDVLEKTENFKPDIVLVDYLDLMYTDARDQRISVGRLMRELRGLAGIRNFALVTATQGNRISATARLVNTNMVAEDWSKIGTADTVCTMSQTLDEKEIGLMRILVAKARRKRDKWIALITQNYDIGQFCLDSTYFNKMVEAEVAKHIGAEEAVEA